MDTSVKSSGIPHGTLPPESRVMLLLFTFSFILPHPIIFPFSSITLRYIFSFVIIGWNARLSI